MNLAAINAINESEKYDQVTAIADAIAMKEIFIHVK
ncbi:MAG: hypothetical protein ACI9Y1_001985 [Lentisphaeria bacterium]|jgi:hypothetical protein